MEHIEDCISFLVGKAAKAVAKRTRAGLAPHGVTPTQYAVLWVLWERDGQTAADIGSRLGIDSATATGVVDRLESSGLIQRHPDEADRRLYHLHLSSRGKALEAPLNKAMADLNQEIRRELGDEAPLFWDALRRVGEITE